jgi:hypothetical protein
MLVPGRSGRKLCNLGSAWDPVRGPELQEWESRTNSELKLFGRAIRNISLVACGTRKSKVSKSVEFF